MSRAFAQNIEVHYNGTVITTNSFEVDSTSTSDYAEKYFYLVNTSGSDQNVSWSRTRTAHDNSIIEDQLCDQVLCFTCDDQTVYNRPGTMTIAAGDSSVFQPKVFPGDVPACLIYTYKVYTGLGALEDSVQIKWRFDSADCFLDVEEESSNIEYSTYPNPANDFFYIQLKSNNNDVSVKIFNILGETVMTENLINGLNQLSINNLNSGVYFYSIIENGKVVETKKIIKR